MIFKKRSDKVCTNALDLLHLPFSRIQTDHLYAATEQDVEVIEESEVHDEPEIFEGEFGPEYLFLNLINLFRTGRPGTYRIVNYGSINQTSPMKPKVDAFVLVRS